MSAEVDGITFLNGEVQASLRRDRACRASRELQKAALRVSIFENEGDDEGDWDNRFGSYDDEDGDWLIDVGRRFFRNRTLRGLHANGRSCADCHQANDNLQLSPATARARWEALQACRAVDPTADDPLFRSIDADDFRTNGASAQSFSNLIDNGLVRIPFPLPPNVKLVDPASCKTATGAAAPCQTAAVYAVSTETEADVWRAVPSIFGVAITGPDGLDPVWGRGPNTTGGYQLDGRIDTLQNQALAALRAHAEIQVDPRSRRLDAVAAFQAALPIPEEAEFAPGSLEEQGKKVFARACAGCHGGANRSTSGFGPDDTLVRQPNLAAGTGVKRYHDIATVCPRPADTVSPARWDFAAAAAAAGFPTPCGPTTVAKTVRTYEFTFADGFKIRRTTSDPGRALLTGFIFSASTPAPPAVCAHPPCGPGPADDFQKMDVPSLHALAQTAPYFHNNSAGTIEEVVIHYEEFFKRVNALNPSTTATTPSNMTSGTILCSDPRCPGTFACSQDNLCRDRPNVASDRDALVAYLKTL